MIYIITVTLPVLLYDILEPRSARGMPRIFIILGKSLFCQAFMPYWRLVFIFDLFMKTDCLVLALSLVPIVWGRNYCHIRFGLLLQL